MVYTWIQSKEISKILPIVHRLEGEGHEVEIVEGKDERQGLGVDLVVDGVNVEVKQYSRNSNVFYFETVSAMYFHPSILQAVGIDVGNRTFDHEKIGWALNQEYVTDVLMVDTPAASMLFDFQKMREKATNEALDLIGKYDTRLQYNTTFNGNHFYVSSYTAVPLQYFDDCRIDGFKSIESSSGYSNDDIFHDVSNCLYASWCKGEVNFAKG